MAKILVVDDVAANRDLLVTLLRHKGHELVEAADGADGLTQVRRERPTLVISDILMPTMDGFEFVHHIRADPAIAATQVIFYTAHYHQREAHNLAVACGVSQVLVKPCLPEDVVRSVDEALAAANMGAGERGAPGRETAAAPAGYDFDRDHVRLMTDQLSHEAGQLEAAYTRLSALSDLNVKLASERDPSRLLQGVCAGARELLGAKYAVLAVREEEPGVPRLFAVSGVPAGAGVSRPALAEGPLREVMTEGRSLRLTDLDGNPVAAGLPPDYPPLKFALAAPLTSLNAIYGWILLADKLGSTEFGDEDQRVLTTLAAQVGRIYESDINYVQIERHAERLQVEMRERENAVAKLRESERRFRQMLDNIRLISVMLDTQMRITYCNDHFLSIAGWTYDEVLGRNWFDTFAPPESVQGRRMFDALLRDDPSSWHDESQIVTRSGERRHIRWNNSVLRAASGQVIGTASIGEDTTERKQAQEKVENLNRVYAVLSGINGLIVRATDRDALINAACHLAVEQGRFDLARIAMLDGQSGEVLTVARAGRETTGIATPQPRFRIGGAPDTLVSIAMQSKQPAICNDLQTDPRALAYREEMLAQGYRSIVALPLIVEGKAIGCFVLVTNLPDFFNETEMRLLGELSADVSFALDHIEKAERLSYLAYYDPLTGLPNRPFFLERLTQAMGNAERSGAGLALVVADTRRFESINESFGRHVGDMVLKMVAQRFSECVGSPADVGRIGPDQFAALIVDAGDDATVAAKVDAWLAQWLGTPFVVNDEELRLSAKAGIARYPADGADANALIRNAESALRTAKSTEDTKIFYTQKLSERFANELALEHKLGLALTNEEFVLYYQPKVDLQTRRLTGVEALIRWQSPDLGLVAPGRFISILEQSGLIVGVGEWALRQACRDRFRWRALGASAPRVAVNVSTVQLKRQDFVASITKILAPLGDDAGIDFEVTESVIIGDVGDNIEKLKSIRDLGVGIAIDDFGTGYSSLSYLAKMPVEILKIDRSFTITMLDDPSAMSLVSTMISLAHSLKLAVVAEGVELEEQAKILRLLRCDQMQGYLISKPLTFDDMTAYLLREED
jgi:diguanylate cyclase (GGDEF)-like protein/PAS domain S-box-containing protein